MPTYSSESYLNKSLYPSVIPSSSISKENPSSLTTFSLLQYFSNFLLRNSFSVKQEQTIENKVLHKHLKVRHLLRTCLSRKAFHLSCTTFKISEVITLSTLNLVTVGFAATWCLAVLSLLAGQILLQLLLSISGSLQRNHHQLAVW